MDATVIRNQQVPSSSLGAGSKANDFNNLAQFPTGTESAQQSAVQPFSGILFKDALTKYLKHRYAEGCKAKSYQQLNGLWLTAFGPKPLNQVTSDDIEDALSDRTVEKKLSPASRKLALAQLNGFMNFALDRDWIHRNPCKRVPKPKVRNERTRWLRVKEIDKLMEVSPDWLKVIIKFGVTSGMRLSELCSLKANSYNTDPNGLAFVITKETKNGSKLRYPLEGWAKEFVEARIKSAKPDDYIFPGPNGGYALMSIRRYLPEACEKAGLLYGRDNPDGVTFHTFRHSMASLAASSGVPLHVIQKMGNWNSFSMVQRYSHLADETLRSATVHMDKLLNDK